MSNQSEKRGSKVSKQTTDSEILTPPARRAEGLREFAASIGVSYDSAFRKAASGELKTVRFGRRILVPAAEVKRVLAEGL